MLLLCFYKNFWFHHSILIFLAFLAAIKMLSLLQHSLCVLIHGFHQQPAISFCCIHSWYIIQDLIIKALKWLYLLDDWDWIYKGRLPIRNLVNLLKRCLNFICFRFPQLIFYGFMLLAHTLLFQSVEELLYETHYSRNEF